MQQNATTAVIRFAAVHLITPTGSKMYNLARLRRAVELLASQKGNTITRLLEDFPRMTRAEASQYVLAAQRCIDYGVDLDNTPSVTD